MPDTAFSEENVYHFLPEETQNEHAAQIRYVHRQGHGDKYRQARDVPVTLRKDQSSRLRPQGSEEHAKLFRVPSSRSIHHLERNKLDRAGAEPRFGVPKKDDDTEEKKKKDAAALLSRVLSVFFPDGRFMSHAKQVAAQRPSLTTPEVMQQARADLGRGPQPVQQNLTINQFLQLNNLTQQIVLSQLSPDQVQLLYGNVNEARGIQGLPPAVIPTPDPKVWIEVLDSDNEDEGKQDTAGVSSLSFQKPPMDSEDEDDGSNPVVLQPAFPIQEGVESVYPSLEEEKKQAPEKETSYQEQSRIAMEQAIGNYRLVVDEHRDVIRGLVQDFVRSLEASYKVGKEGFFQDLLNGDLIANSGEYYSLKEAWGRLIGRTFTRIDWKDLFQLFHSILSGGQGESGKPTSFTFSNAEDLRNLKKYIQGLQTTMGKGVMQAGRGKGKGRGSTPWIELVKKVQRERKISYKEAMKVASRMKK